MPTGTSTDPNAWVNNPNVQQAMIYFQNQGWTPEQSAGIVANLHAESGVNPNVKPGDNGLAVGIGQWWPIRQDAFRDWSNGLDLHSAPPPPLDTQLGFVQHELTDGLYRHAGNKLRNAQSAQDAGAIVSNFYEQPKDPYGDVAYQRGLLADNLINSTLYPADPNGPQHLPDPVIDTPPPGP